MEQAVGQMVGHSAEGGEVQVSRRKGNERPAVLEDLIGAVLLLVSRRAGALISGAEIRLAERGSPWPAAGARE
jgi:hypothetical protein